MKAAAQVDDGGASVALAILRATLVPVIFVTEHLVDSKQLLDAQFPIVLAIAAAYALAGIVSANSKSQTAASRVLVRFQPACDVLLLAALAYASGGAFSDLRKAFFVIPLAAAFSERPRSTASWTLVAVGAFSLQAVIAANHPHGVHNSWPRMTLDQDLYLAWTGAVATMLAFALRRRSAQTEEIANSRQRLVTHAIESVERERSRLADALHDTAVQNLIAARHDLRRAQRDGDAESFLRLHEAIDLTVAELREEIFNLHPHVLDQVGLSAALEQVARRHADEDAPRVTVDIDPEAGRTHRQVLFALGRELMGNAAKHAQANRISLAVRLEGDHVALEVTDDGRGIPSGRTQRALLDGHIGLASVTERVAALGGELTIDTSPRRGTCVRVLLPATRGSEDAQELAVEELVPAGPPRMTWLTRRRGLRDEGHRTAERPETVVA